MIQHGEDQLTYRKLVDTYIYGDVIHYNKRDNFKQWVDANFKKDIIYTEIVDALNSTLKYIRFFNQLNQEYADFFQINSHV